MWVKLSESKKKLSEHSFSKHPYPSLISTTILTIYFNSSEREREKKENNQIRHSLLSLHALRSFLFIYFIFYYLFSERRSSFQQNSKIEKLELKCSSSDSNSLRNTCWWVCLWVNSHFSTLNDLLLFLFIFLFCLEIICVI